MIYMRQLLFADPDIAFRVILISQI